MSGINDALKDYGFVLKTWVCRFQSCFVLCMHACVRVCLSFLFPDSCRITWDTALLFCPRAIKCMETGSSFKRCDKCEVTSHEVALDALRTANTPEFCPAFASTKPISAQHRDSVCSVRWQPGLKRRRHSWMITQYDLFPSFTPHYFSTSPLFRSVCLFLSPLKERNICSRPKGDTLNTSSFSRAGRFSGAKWNSIWTAKGNTCFGPGPSLHWIYLKCKYLYSTYKWTW